MSTACGKVIGVIAGRRRLSIKLCLRSCQASCSKRVSKMALSWSRASWTRPLTLNTVEAVNGQLERLRRNSGGYFQSDDTLKMKLGLTITSLANGRWYKVNGRVQEALDQLNAIFETRFEREA